jgi:hypothetical protein
MGKGHRLHLEEDGTSRGRVEDRRGPRWGGLGDDEDDFKVKGGRGMAGDLAAEFAGILGEEVDSRLSCAGVRTTPRGRARN